MKKMFVILALAVLSTTSAFAQEIVSDVSEFMYRAEDSTTYVKHTLIRTTSIEGINDTLVQYTEVADSVTAVQSLFTAAVNQGQTLANPYVKGFSSKGIIGYLNAQDAYLEQLTGVGYFARLASAMSSHYVGRWRFRLDTLDVFVNIIEHPTVPGFYRAVEDVEVSPRVWNVKPFVTDKLFAILNFEGQTRWLVLNEAASQNRPIYQSAGAIIPVALGGLSPASILTAVRLQ